MRHRWPLGLAALGSAVSTSASAAPSGGATATLKLDPLSLLFNASIPVRLTVLLLFIAGTSVWIITLLKVMQLGRLRRAERAFEQFASRAESSNDLFGAAARFKMAPGSRVVLELVSRNTATSVERLRAIADRALVRERHRASTLLSLLGSIAAASPFIGLFGTVYGIMDAFLRIGQEKSASLPVVAPAIGEALITTAIGLVAAIPAVIFYNAIDKRVSDLIDEVEAAAAEWVTVVAAASDSHQTIAMPLTRPISQPPAGFVG